MSSITSVTRDDLPDGGAAQFAAAVAAVRDATPEATVEVLIPDLGGDEAALRAVLAARPDVLNHNLETVPRLYPRVRPQARYERSLELLRARAAAWARSPPSSRQRPPRSSRPASWSASVRRRRRSAAVLADAAAAGVDAMTIGQYLQPETGCLPVARYVTPEEFAGLRAPGRRARAHRGRGVLRALVLPRRRASGTGRVSPAEPSAAPRGEPWLAAALPLPTPAVVVFDLDYTLLRPSDQFEAPGYVRTGARFGLELDPARWPQAERAAYIAAAARREETGLIHDDGLLPVIANAIIAGLGGGPAAAVERDRAGDHRRLVAGGELRPLRRRPPVSSTRCASPASAWPCSPTRSATAWRRSSPTSRLTTTWPRQCPASRPAP